MKTLGIGISTYVNHTTKTNMRIYNQLIIVQVLGTISIYDTKQGLMKTFSANITNYQQMRLLPITSWTNVVSQEKFRHQASIFRKRILSIYLSNTERERERERERGGENKIQYHKLSISNYQKVQVNICITMVENSSITIRIKTESSKFWKAELVTKNKILTDPQTNRERLQFHTPMETVCLSSKIYCCVFSFNSLVLVPGNSRC